MVALGVARPSSVRVGNIHGDAEPHDTEAPVMTARGPLATTPPGGLPLPAPARPTASAPPPSPSEDAALSVTIGADASEHGRPFATAETEQAMRDHPPSRMVAEPELPPAQSRSKKLVEIITNVFSGSREADGLPTERYHEEYLGVIANRLVSLESDMVKAFTQSFEQMDTFDENLYGILNSYDVRLTDLQMRQDFRHVDLNNLASKLDNLAEDVKRLKRDQNDLGTALGMQHERQKTLLQQRDALPNVINEIAHVVGSTIHDMTPPRKHDYDIDMVREVLHDAMVRVAD